MTRFAKIISVAGHPLITIPLFVSAILFRTMAIEKAVIITGLLVCGIILPLTIKMARGVKQGRYTNFDVSDRKQRKGWYFFAIGLLVITTIILFVTKQSRAVCFGFLLSTLLLISSQLANYFIKSSLHVAFNVFLWFMIAPFSVFVAAVFAVFVIVIAWSRIYLDLHSVKEVIFGAIIGALFGVLLLVYG